MNIKDKIIEWQGQCKDEFACGDNERSEMDAELEMVLFAIDALTNKTLTKSPTHTPREAMRIRSQASNPYCSDDEFLNMINGDK